MIRMRIRVLASVFVAGVWVSILGCGSKAPVQVNTPALSVFVAGDRILVVDDGQVVREERLRLQPGERVDDYMWLDGELVVAAVGADGVLTLTRYANGRPVDRRRLQGVEVERAYLGPGGQFGAVSTTGGWFFATAWNARPVLVARGIEDLHAWPEGDRVCLMGRLGGSASWYRIREGQVAVEATDTERCERSLTFDPSGSFAAFVSTEGADGETPHGAEASVPYPNADVLVASVGELTSGWRRIVDSTADESDPRWSPDGRHIAFTRRREDSPAERLDVAVVDVESGRQMTVHRDAQMPRWIDK